MMGIHMVYLYRILLVCVACRSTALTSSRISIGNVTTTISSTFMAHGWEPWSATQAFSHFREQAFRTAFSHLRGQTIRFGGISADWLHYIVNNTVSEPCFWGERQPFTAGGQCNFSTGSFDALLDFLRNAGVGLVFDLNELIGRNCTQIAPPHSQLNQMRKQKLAPEHKSKPPPNQQWCGSPAAEWDTAPVQALLEHVRRRGLDGIVGFELGNELFAPRHLSRGTALADIAAAAALLRQVWNWNGGGTDGADGTNNYTDTSSPLMTLYATGTNDCERHNNSETMAALLRVQGIARDGLQGGFSFHSYPGNAEHGWNKSKLETYLLNSTWLRHETFVQASPCLAAWNDGGFRSSGLRVAVTEAAAMCGGSIEPSAPTTASFVHGFFSIVQLGQFAQAGVNMLARWGVPDLLGLSDVGPGQAWDPSRAAADLFLYTLHNNTVGRAARALRVDGDEASNALVFAYCTAIERLGADNGTVTIVAANPSPMPVALVLASLRTRPRREFVLTAPAGNLSSHTPVLNGDEAHPLSLSKDGSLPTQLVRPHGVFCTNTDTGSSAAACTETLMLPPRSQSFFVLLGAGATACL